ncbi:histidine kinase [Glaciihabitans sp. UYNi722]|uniref:sensor histidine kinase n=1 Tax=Glaciihabitans sp. UYNi722 TaxID=3156344 RepID=UPI0033987FFB
MFRTLQPYQLVVDIVFAALFFLIGLASSASSAHWVDLAVCTIMSAALAFRRLSPGLSLIIAWVAAIIQMVSAGTVPAFADFAVFGILFCTGSYGGRVVRWLGLASAGLGAVIATFYIVALPVIAQYGPWATSTDSSFVLAGGDLLRSLVLTLFGFLAVFGLSWTLGLLARTLRRARESRRAQALAERDVAIEQERNRIARDMHDVVAHSLAVVIAQADGARYAQASSPGSADAALTTISATAREALGDVRILLSQLRHSQGESPQPVLEDIDKLVDQMRAAGLTIIRTERGTPVILPTGQQLAIYRIVQEALTNALRHGDTAQEVRLAFDWQPSASVVTITSARREDAVDNPGGHGLAGMRERAVLAGGTFTAEASDSSFAVSGSFPNTARGTA